MAAAQGHWSIKAALGVGAIVALLLGVGQPVGRPASADAALKASFARLPLSFVANRGQLDRRVAFAVQGRDASALFTGRGVRYVLGGRYVVKVDFVGARAAEPVGQRRLGGIVSVFRGDRSQWRTGIPTFGGIVYRDLWPGIDLVWSGERGRLKYTLVVRPGGDPAAIKLRYRGAVGRGRWSGCADAGADAARRPAGREFAACLHAARRHGGVPCVWL